MCAQADTGHKNGHSEGTSCLQYTACLWPVIQVDSKPEKLVSAEEAGEFLGFWSMTIRRKATKGLIPAIPFKANTRTVWRFQLSKLQQFADDQQQLTRANGQRCGRRSA
jgi:hypothetical protein